MLLCLWRGKALMEIIGLLGSDISKFAISFPSLPSLRVFDTILMPRPPAAAVLYDKIHPSLIFSLSLSFSLSMSLAHLAMINVLICYPSDFAMLLVHIEVAEQSNCETTVPESDILVKINMDMSVSFNVLRDCVDFDCHSLSFLKLDCRTLMVISHKSNISEKQIVVVVWLIVVTRT